MRKTATQELKQDFADNTKPYLPVEWIIKYIDKFHSKTKGIEVVRIDRNLQNVNKGQAAPTPNQLVKIKSLIQ